MGRGLLGFDSPYPSLFMVEIYLVLFAYLLGSIPTGVILAKKFGTTDLRKVGSGNIGAANVARSMGKKFGLLTLCGDCMKGFIPVLIARHLGEAETWLAITALAAILGHLFPLYLKFKGGKGVATALGVYLALVPKAALIVLCIWAVMLVFTRISSIGSLSAAIIMPIVIGFMYDSRIYLVLSLVITLLIFYTHRENIKRLMKGKEISIN